MASRRMSDVIELLRRGALLREVAGVSDGQLLECFLSRRERSAVEALVRRHGAMVWGVCRRILGNHHDAEDAFQATFLVLVRKAASIRPRDMVANWLHGVAYQTARKARATAAKRKTRERQVVEMPEPEAAEQDLRDDLQPLLDLELGRLPDKYRAVILLCDLEGKTRSEAARQLGCPEGTVAGRLARARVLLARRLVRHGLTVSGGALAAMLAQGAASAGVPAAVASETIKVAGLVAAGQAAGVISVPVAGLVEGVLKTMLLTKLKTLTALLLVLATLGLGAGGLIPWAPAGAGAAPPGQQEPQPDDMLKQARERQKVEEQQRIQRLKEEALKEALPKIEIILKEIETRIADKQAVRAVLEEIENAIKEKRGAAQPKPPERKPVWTLDFHFKNPRPVTVDIPGQGKQTVWYWWYEVVNTTEEERTFIPEFELLLGDKVYHDRVIPRAQEAIHRLEDPTGARELHSSVTIAKEPIPPSKPGGRKKGVAGVALWDDVDPEARSFTIFVSGLSNGWSTEGDTVRRKTLKISFKRMGQEMVPTGPAEWIYRGGKLKLEEKKDESGEIGKLIRELQEYITGLENAGVKWKQERQRYQDQIRELRNRIDRPAGNLSREERVILLGESLLRIQELEREIASGDHGDKERAVIAESNRQRLEQLRRQLLQKLDGPPPEQRKEEAQRQLELNKLKRGIADMEQRRRQWKDEQEEIQPMIAKLKKLIALQPDDSDTQKEKHKRWREVVQELERQLESGTAEDVSRQVELQLMERRRKALEREESEKKAAPSKPGGDDDVQGMVKEVGEGNLLRISIGSDAGLVKGDRLEIYRLQPKPVYVGRAKILEVATRESVAQLISGKDPRPGDQVARTLVGR
jgi:RNA polymerase sigma factor (sigma-70 family)